MLLLVIHGCAGVLWQTPNQLLLYDIVGPADLPSAVRLNATARYLGILVGPAVGRRHHAGARPLPRHHFQHAVLSADAALAVLGAHQRQGRRAPAHPGPRPCRHRADHPRHRHAAGPDLDDAARRADLLHDRQRLPRPDAGLCDRPRARRPRRVLQRAAGRRRRRRAACGHRAGSVGTAQADAPDSHRARNSVEPVPARVRVR